MDPLCSDVTLLISLLPKMRNDAHQIWTFPYSISGYAARIRIVLGKEQALTTAIHLHQRGEKISKTKKSAQAFVKPNQLSKTAAETLFQCHYTVVYCCLSVLPVG